MKPMKGKVFKPVMILLLVVLFLVSMAVFLFCRADQASCMSAFHYVALGDSYSLGQTPYGEAEGYGYTDFIKDKLAAAGVLAEYSKKGAGHGTTDNTLKQLPSISKLLADADIVTLSAGIDDIQNLKEFKAYQTEPSPENMEALKTAAEVKFPEISSNLKQIIGAIKAAHSDSPPSIYLMGYFNVYPYLPELDAVINSLNNTILSAAAETDVSYVSTKEVLDKDLRRYLPGDAHPTVEGYEQIAEAFWGMIREDFLAEPSFPKTLNDINGHWAEARIRKYMNDGIVTGFTDGSFRPDRAVSRAEFITVINRFFKLADKTEISFPDVSENAWYRAQLEIAVKAGYVAANPMAHFKADEQVTRQEAAVIIAKKMDFVLSDQGNEAERYEDWQEIPAWSLGSVNALLRYGIMEGYPDNHFRCQGYVTRAEVLSLLDRLTPYVN